ncbi:PilZ domain-containing protein [Paenibacillus tarimensis]
MNILLGSKGQKRQHVRLQLTSGLMAELRLIEVDGEPIKSRPARVLLKDMSPGGLKFLTYLKFPVASNYRVKFDMVMNRNPLVLTGRIVWRRKQSNVYEYGISFTMSIKERPRLLFALNQILLQQSPCQQKIHRMYRLLNDPTGSFSNL